MTPWTLISHALIASIVLTSFSVQAAEGGTGPSQRDGIGHFTVGEHSYALPRAILDLPSLPSGVHQEVLEVAVSPAYFGLDVGPSKPDSLQIALSTYPAASVDRTLAVMALTHNPYTLEQSSFEGLTALKFTRGAGPGQISYFVGSSGDQSSIVQCLPDSRDPNMLGRCVDTFTFADLSVSIWFWAIRLAEWEAIHRAAVSMLEQALDH